MKIATIKRGESTDEGTFSSLALGLDAMLYATEIPWRDNDPNMSCIPPGKYVCHQRFSSRFQCDLYEVLNVPNRSAILIHVGNFGGDTAKGFKTDLQGCIAPAMFIGKIGVQRDGKTILQRAGCDSFKAVAKLMAWAVGEDFRLVIK